MLQTEDPQVADLLQRVGTDGTFWDSVFAATAKNLETVEDTSTFGVSLCAGAALGRLLEAAYGGQARNRWATAAEWLWRYLAPTFMCLIAPAVSWALKREHALLSTTRNPYQPAPLSCCSQAAEEKGGGAVGFIELPGRLECVCRSPWSCFWVRLDRVHSSTNNLLSLLPVHITDASSWTKIILIKTVEL